MNAQTTLSSKGQVVIPKDVRERLHWELGEPLDVVEMANGVFLKRRSVPKRLSDKEALARIRAIVKYDGPTVTIEEMNETINEGYRLAALKSDSAKR
jgi:AbrB family looped-hinge helix DNA binding protein